MCCAGVASVSDVQQSPTRWLPGPACHMVAHALSMGVNKTGLDWTRFGWSCAVTVGLVTPSVTLVTDRVVGSVPRDGLTMPGCRCSCM